MLALKRCLLTCLCQDKPKTQRTESKLKKIKMWLNKYDNIEETIIQNYENNFPFQ